ncbi:MAG: hypothetical protein KDA24_07470 [Deltaproteobacteria bacterium]|nr:hypothetical protein [Deltaproteobacteria bacterium]
MSTAATATFSTFSSITLPTLESITLYDIVPVDLAPSHRSAARAAVIPLPVPMFGATRAVAQLTDRAVQSLTAFMTGAFFAGVAYQIALMW